MDHTFSKSLDSAPTALDTLKKLAPPLGNDANYAATFRTQLSNKADRADRKFTGLLTANAVSVTNGMGASGNTTFGGPVTDT